MTNNALTVQEEISLVQYGSRNAARELAERLKLTMPNAQKYTDQEALAVAQIALAHDLDPFNGEVWGIKGGEKWYGVMVGIKGLRKASNKQAIKEKTTYWFEYQVPMDTTPYTANKNDRVYLAFLRDTVNVQAWSQAINSLTTAGVPYKEAVTMLGSAPVVIGVGVANPGEQSKMRLEARAKKRAEADALKQRFNVEFAGAQQADYDMEDADLIEVKPQPSIKVYDLNTEPDEVLRELGFDTHPKDPNPYDYDESLTEDDEVLRVYPDGSEELVDADEPLWSDERINEIADAKIGITSVNTILEVLEMSTFVHPGMNMDYVKRFINKVALNRKAGIPRDEAVKSADSFIADLLSNEK